MSARGFPECSRDGEGGERWQDWGPSHVSSLRLPIRQRRVLKETE